MKHSRLWKILKDMGLCVTAVGLDTFKRLYQQQQAAVRVDSELTDWFEISRGADKAVWYLPLLFNCYSEQVMRESADVLSWIGVTVTHSTTCAMRLTSCSSPLRQQPSNSC